MQWATDECKIIQIQAAAATYMCVRLGQSKAFLHALNNLPDNLFLVFFFGKVVSEVVVLGFTMGCPKVCPRACGKMCPKVCPRTNAKSGRNHDL